MFFATHRSIRRPHRVTPSRTRLWLSRLEDRTVPTTFTVMNANDSGAGSLRQAILDANSAAGADTIDFDTIGTFVSPQTILLPGGEMAITDSLTITGTGSNRLVLKNTKVQSATSRIFNIDGAGTLTVAVSGLTITGGATTTSGGGVTIADESVTFTDCLITKNSMSTAVAVVPVPGGAGVAITAAGNVTFINSAINTNYGIGTTPKGGGIWCTTTGAMLTIQSSSVSGNTTSGNQAAMYLVGCGLDMKDSTVANNSTSGTGGIWLQGTPPVLTIVSSTIYGNNSSNGSAIRLSNCNTDLIIRNSTITGNLSSQNGGGINRNGGTGNISIESTVIAGNFGFGSLGRHDVENGTTQFTYQNSFIGNNSGITNPVDLGGNLEGTPAAPLNAKLGPLTSNGGFTLTCRPLTGSPLIDVGSNSTALATDQRGQARQVGAAVDMGAVEVDPNAPLASGATPDLLVPGGTTYTFTVTYTDDTAINVGTLDSNDLRVTGPNGFDLLATFVSVSPAGNGTPRVATYQFTAPGGAWDSADAGLYSVAMQAGQVTDNGAAPVAAGLVSQFSSPNFFVVTTNVDAGAGSLRQAVLDANATVGTDAIAFDTAGIFASPQTIVLTSGELVLSDAVNITGTGNNRLTVFNGKASSTTSHIFNIAGAGTVLVNIADMAIAGGNTTNAGGAVTITDEVVAFNNCVFFANQTTTTGGGAIAATGTGLIGVGRVTITNSLFVGNSATGTASNGGALRGALGTNFVLVNCTLSGNTAGNKGGAIYIIGATTAGSGLNLINSTVSGNQSLIGEGGGIYFRNNVSPTTGVVIRNSTITGNTSANNAGGLRFRYIVGTLNIQNSTITGNTARFNGGGFDWSNAGTPAPTMNIESSIIAGNSAGLGGFDIANGGSQLINLSNSVLGSDNAANVTDLGGNIVNPAVPVLLGALSGNGGPTLSIAPQVGSPVLDVGSNSAGSTTDQRGLARQVGAGVDIGAVEFNANSPAAKTTALANITTGGGTSYTLTLTYSDDTAIMTSTIDSSDIRVVGPNGFNVLATLIAVDTGTNGTPRIATYSFTAPGGTWDAVDFGLYSVYMEANQVTDTGATAVPSGLQGLFTVNVGTTRVVNATNDEATDTDGKTSLREALLLANAVAGLDLITFDPTVFASASTIMLTLGALVVSDSTNIVGTGASMLTVNSTGAASTTRQVFNLNGPGFLNISISGMTISGGNTTAAGGGVTIGDENVTFTNCTLTNNTTTTTGGGAVAMITALGRLTLQSCTLSNNTTTGTTADGGAIRGVSQAQITIQDSIITGNTTGDDGGAIYLIGNATAGGLNVFNSTIANNSATSATLSNGGAIAFTTTVALPNGFIVSNSTISGNSAGLNGGAIEFFDNTNGTAFIRNSTITNNTAGGTGANQGGGGIHSLDVTTPYPLTINFTCTIVSGNNNAAAPDIFAKGIVAYGTSAIGSATGIATPVDNGGNLGFGTALFLGALSYNGGPAGMLTHLPGGVSAVRDAGSNPAALATDQRGFARLLNASVDIGSIESVGGIPSASGTFGSINTVGGTLYSLTILYADETSIKVSTLDSADIRIKGPNGFNVLATYKSASPGTNAATEAASYEFVPPGGTWDDVDNGLYTVSIEGSQVADNSGNFVPAGTLGTFNVGIPQSLLVTNANDAGTGSLRAALLAANGVVSNDTINFDPLFFNVSRTITLTTGELPISDNVIINGPDSRLTTISGNSASRIFNIGGPGTLVVSISNLTLSGGKVAAAGGAILVDNEALTISNSVITANTSTATGGGGIAMTGAGTLTLTSCTVAGNAATAVNGGGLLLNAAATLNLNLCSISNNTAANGAGLHLTNVTALVSNSAINLNTATSQGGGVFLTGAVATNLTFLNCTLAGNKAADGGAYRGQNVKANLVLNNSTLTGNSVSVNGGGINWYPNGGTISIESTIIASNLAAGAALHPDVENNNTPFSYKNSLIRDQNGLTAGNDLGGNLAAGTDPLLAPLGSNGGPTATCLPGIGSPVLDVGSNPASLTTDQRGFARLVGIGVDMGAVEVQPAVAAPVVTKVSVNAGAAQRSRVTALSVTFDQLVSFTGAPDAAFQLVRTFDTKSVTLSATVDNTGPGTVVTFTFTGGAVDKNSLQDGMYTLTALASTISSPGGQLDGDANGTGGDNYNLVGNTTTAPKLFRLFGDSDGDGDVDITDFVAFRAALGTGPSIFDFDNDGDTDNSDFTAFRTRVGVMVP